MKRIIAAQQVLSARTSDTGDGVRVVLLDESGEETVVTLPLDQLAILSSWLEQAGRLADGEPASARPPAPSIQVEKWTVRPEADEEFLTLGFRLVKGGEINLRMHRTGAAAYVKALASLLGRLLPASPSKAKH
ncbi:hypothetical protein CU669_07870 [Paramagnetospirillum kuznetsovii]|uniref:Uncharacterized protein n=1 Tax=Paramagnetospirillum kuznetsovii TaxID=2053833 RepID=A0A364P0P1_9PROT|nr:hypothetical protein [Paramagnetospirillum kuznetsovii]RAU22727.1 hypothetical protein CU669_07870 [Paramagnetospirillum kuznetsovii]